MGKVGKAFNRAFGGIGKGISRAFGGGRGLAAIISVVASIAIPFAAPAIATAIGASGLLGSTLVGAALGAGAGALSGSLTGNLGRGMLLGGLGGAAGGFFGGGGTIGSIFGGGAPAAGAAGVEGAGLAAGAEGAGLASGTITSEALAPIAGTTVAPDIATRGLVSAVGDAAGAAAPALASAAPSTAPTAATTGIGSGAQGAAPQVAAGATEPADWFSRFGSGFTGPAPIAGKAASPSIFTAEGLGAAVGRLASPTGLASVGQLAVTMFNKPESGLTAEERAYLDETRQLAGTNQDLFNERVSAARRIIQSGQANPEQAYAQAQINTERRFREAGLRSQADERRALIEGARLGALAVPAEQARAAQTTSAGLQAMPTTAPMGPSSYGLAVARDAERRRAQYSSDLARGIGGLAGALGGNRSTLFG